MQEATSPDDTPARCRWDNDHPRLQMESPARLTMATMGAAALGMVLGGAHGGRTATLRFRAEHAHRMPARTTDWYFYHRSKNYNALKGGVREGFRMGARLGIMALGLVWLEHTVDQFRGRADLFSTVVASLSVSGGFSLWSKSDTTKHQRNLTMLPKDSFSERAGGFHVSRMCQEGKTLCQGSETNGAVGGWSRPVPAHDGRKDDQGGARFRARVRRTAGCAGGGEGRAAMVRGLRAAAGGLARGEYSRGE
ncbi:hypothetical protein IMZ48_31385 [Candidatus Bathyarchaeota archaeon]|nr:hypothetical protein [Candidatus Bathyarchaeota archaeon]